MDGGDPDGGPCPTGTLPRHEIEGTLLLPKTGEDLEKIKAQLDSDLVHATNAPPGKLGIVLYPTIRHGNEECTTARAVLVRLDDIRAVASIDPKGENRPPRRYSDRSVEHAMLEAQQ